MDKETLWLELYRGRDVNESEFKYYFSPNGPMPTTEYIHYIKNQYSDIIIRIYAYIIDGKVSNVSASKRTDSGMGHFRYTSVEKKLTGAEKKEIQEILNFCFPDRAKNELLSIIRKAVEKKAQYNGYAIQGETSKGIAYVSPDGKPGTLSKNRVLQALNYSHVNIAIVADIDTVKAFSTCFSKQPWEPLAAVLSVVDVTQYSEYERLYQEYCLAKFEEAIHEGNVSECEKLIDASSISSEKFVDYISYALTWKHNDVFLWLMEKVSRYECNLNKALYTAIYENDQKAIDLIIGTGKCFPCESDFLRKSGTPMSAADYRRNVDVKKRLIRLGYPGEIDVSRLSTDEIRDLIQYPIDITIPMWNRVWSERQEDIIQVIVNRLIAEKRTNWLLLRHVENCDWESFCHALKEGYDINGFRLFDNAWRNGCVWTDELLGAGYDINQDHGMALHRAVERRDLQFAKYLIEHGANIHEIESCGSVIDKAVATGGKWSTKDPVNEELVSYLLECGADPSECMNGIFECSESIKVKAIDILAKSGKINHVDKEGHLPLYYAIKHIDDGSVISMIEKGAYVDARGICEDLLFDEAFVHCYENERIWKAMIKAGANVNEESFIRRTPLLYAYQRKAPDQYFEVLIDAGADVNRLYVPYYTSSDPRRYDKNCQIPRTLLDYAIASGDERIAELFKKHGALTSEQIKASEK